MHLDAALLVIGTRTAFSRVVLFYLLICLGCGSASWEDYMEAGFEAQQSGRYAEAEEVLLLASRLASTFAADDLRRATTLDNLADVYRAQGRDLEAEALYQQALAHRVEILGSAHQRVAVGLENLGRLYTDQGSYAAAAPAYWRALEITEANLGPGDPDVATILIGLGRVHHAQTDYAEAERLYQRALRIRERAFGLDDVTVAEVLEAYADLLRQTGREGDAIPMEARARDIRPEEFVPMSIR